MFQKTSRENPLSFSACVWLPEFWVCSFFELMIRWDPEVANFAFIYIYIWIWASVTSVSLELSGDWWALGEHCTSSIKPEDYQKTHSMFADHVQRCHTCFWWQRYCRHNYKWQRQSSSPYLSCFIFKVQQGTQKQDKSTIPWVKLTITMEIHICSIGKSSVTGSTDHFSIAMSVYTRVMEYNQQH